MHKTIIFARTTMNMKISQQFNAAYKALMIPCLALIVTPTILIANIAFAEQVIDTQLTRVTVTSFESLSFNAEKNAPAMVKSLNISKIPAKISATLKRKHALVGEKFKQGDLLAELDCREQEFNVTVQEANYNQLENQQSFLRREVERGNKLYLRQNFGEADLDRRKTDLINTSAQLNAQSALLSSAKLDASRCYIYAPYNGIVSKTIASVGEMLNKGDPVFEMVENQHGEVSAQIALSDVKSLQHAVKYYFQSEGVSYPLTMRTLVDTIATNELSIEARFTFSSANAIIGSSGRLFWVSPKLTLPAHLLQKRNNEYGVFVVKTNIEGTSQAIFIPVKDSQEGRPINIQHAPNWQNKSIIIDGRHGLINNQRISIQQTNPGNKKQVLGAK
jgi:RND family efflux transporter MFP subunit